MNQKIIISSIPIPEQTLVQRGFCTETKNFEGKTVFRLPTMFIKAILDGHLNVADPELQEPLDPQSIVRHTEIWLDIETWGQLTDEVLLFYFQGTIIHGDPESNPNPVPLNHLTMVGPPVLLATTGISGKLEIINMRGSEVSCYNGGVCHRRNSCLQNVRIETYPQKTIVHAIKHNDLPPEFMEYKLNTQEDGYAPLHIRR